MKANGANHCLLSQLAIIKRWAAVFWRKTRKAKNRQYLRRDAVDAHSSVGPFSAQSLSQFDHTGLGCVV